MKEFFNAIPPQIYAYLGAFLLAVLSATFMIPFLRRVKCGQVVREDGPQSHKTKTGTPTMGGFLFLIPLVLLGVLYAFRDIRILPLVLSTVAFGFIGFLDDYIKVVKKHNKGLDEKQKMIGLLLVSGAFTWYAVSSAPGANTLVLPVLGLSNPIALPLVIAIPFAIFVLVAFSNAVNLTDGLDGLNGCVTTIVLLFYTLVSMFTSQWDYIRIFCALLAGGLMGFLVFNLHPAKIFMGDLGSLALGGAVASVALVTGTAFFLGLAGIIYVCEALSVVIQVFYFKKTGKRFFKMAPIHHHFELLGWKETKVVTVFTLVTLAMSALAWFLLQ